MSQLIDGQYTPVTADQADAWREDGWWENRSVRSLLTEAAQNHPDRVAAIGHRTIGARRELTYRQLDAEATHVASVLASLGVEQGDSVVLMLPNWVEYPAFVYGINQIGAIYAGIPVAYGRQQALAILRRSKAKVLVIPRRHRSTEHLELSRELRSELPDLEHVIVVDDDSAGLRDDESTWASFSDVPDRTFADPEPGRICYLGFTSGTTGEPKGAIHTHDTLVYAARRQAEHVGPAVYGEPMIHLVASPCGHHTGFEWGIVMTTLLAGTGVYVDRWEPNWGAEVIRSEGVTCFFGAPTFLQDMMRTDLVDDPSCPLTCLVIAGSPVPRNLPEQAGRALGAYIAPAWGLTECSIMSSCTPDEPREIQRTDGSIYAGSEVKVVDANGDEVPAGVTGDLLMRGPGVVLGYFDRHDATEDAYLPGLWFRTGDTASVDQHGWLSLRGRSKDIIIRGGENIPVTDVESLIFDHPDVLNAAVVGVPDERLGERICAVLVTKPDVVFTVDSLAEYLLGQGLSKHYLPERVVSFDELPMTQSGKIQKFKLRELVASSVEAVV